MAWLLSANSGSSPLSRGIRVLGDGRFFVVRIIPALAGNTKSGTGLLIAATDHPRSRGEYLIMDIGEELSCGSSPLSRGIHGGTPTPRGGRRIIPALAGNTCRFRRAWCTAPDHPRSRGEYPRRRLHCLSGGGSSPLSRGILFADPMSNVSFRIIPALAGNTPARKTE